jgi:hypothetical protein
MKFIIAIIFLVTSISAFGQFRYEEVVFTYNMSDIDGLEEVCPINEAILIPFGEQAKLKEKVFIKAQKTAFLNGANIIFVKEEISNKLPIRKSVGLIGTAYFKKEIAIDLEERKKKKPESCEDIKSELDLYKQKFGNLRYNKSVLINSFDDDINFNIVSVEGNEALKTVTINFYMFSREKPKNVRLEACTTFGKTKIIDTNGNQFAFKIGGMGDNTSACNPLNKLSTGLKLNGFVTFSGVTPNLEQLGSVVLNFSCENYDNEEKEVSIGAIEIRNLFINWK